MSQEKLLQYIHFNRHHNTLLVQHNTKLIEDLRTENTHLIQENIRKDDQISKLRTDVDNIESEHSSLPRSIEENTKLIEQLRINIKFLLPGK